MITVEAAAIRFVDELRLVAGLLVLDRWSCSMSSIRNSPKTWFIPGFERNFAPHETSYAARLPRIRIPFRLVWRDSPGDLIGLSVAAAQSVARCPAIVTSCSRREPRPADTRSAGVSGSVRITKNDLAILGVQDWPHLDAVGDLGLHP